MKKLLPFLFLLPFVAYAVTTVPWTKNGTNEYPTYQRDKIGLAGTTTPSELLTIDPKHITSANLLTNGSFSGSLAGWTYTPGNGWAYSAGTALYTPQSGTIFDPAYSLAQSFPMDLSHTYLLTYTVAGVTQGCLGIFDLTNFNFFTEACADGTYTLQIAPTTAGTSDITLDPTDFDSYDGLDAFNGSITSISMAEYAASGDLLGVYDWFGSPVTKITEGGNNVFGGGDDSLLTGAPNFGNGFNFHFRNSTESSTMLFTADSPMTNANGNFGFSYQGNNQASFGFLNNVGSYVYFIGNAARLVGDWGFPTNSSYPSPNLASTNSSTGDVRLKIDKSGDGLSQTVYGYTQAYASNGIQPALQLQGQSVGLYVRNDDTWNDNVSNANGVLGLSLAPATGYVGIGATTSPGSILSVTGVANFTAATSTFYGNGLNLTNGCYAIAGNCIGMPASVGTSLPKGNFLVGNDLGLAQATSSIFISSTGQVSIATTTHATAANLYIDDVAGGVSGGLIVAGDSTTVGPLFRMQDNTLANNNFNLRANPSGSAATALSTIPLSDSFQTGSASTGGAYFVTAASTAPIVFGTGGTALSNERMRITSTGQIGVGTTTPAFQLQIAATTASAAFKPQLALTDPSAGANLKHWTIASEGGNLYFATSTDLYATSTAASLSIDRNNNVNVSSLSASQTVGTDANKNLVSISTPTIVGNDRKTGLTAAQALATYTVGASDASYQVSANILVTAATLHSFTGTIAYTDEGNTSRTLTMNFSTIAGALTPTIANAGGAAPYEGVPLHIRAKAGTTIVVATAGTFTTVTYNFEERILQE